MDAKSKTGGELGSCMYCGSSENLTDEHIIPFGMGGDLILRKSSCEACAAKTSLDERKVLRGFMYEGRLVGGFPSRRKKKQPKTIKRKLFREDGTEFTKDLLIKSGVSVIHLPIFTDLGILSGQKTETGISIQELITIHLGTDNLEELRLKEDISGLKFQTDIDVTAFCRLLSKIAYGHHIQQCGLFPKEESPALSIINKSEMQFGKWIGSQDVPFPKSSALHLIQMRTFQVETIGKVYIVAINLFNKFGVGSSYLVTTRICKDS